MADTPRNGKSKVGGAAAKKRAGTGRASAASRKKTSTRSSAKPVSKTSSKAAEEKKKTRKKATVRKTKEKATATRAASPRKTTTKKTARKTTRTSASVSRKRPVAKVRATDIATPRSSGPSTEARFTASVRPCGRPEARRRPRHRCQTVPCNLGEILDLSTQGARVLCKPRLRGSCVLVMPRGHGWFTVPCRVIWTRRLGFRRHLVGLEFIEVDAPDFLAQIIREYRLDDREAA